MQTARTEYNKIISNCSKKELSQIVSTPINKLTFVITNLDKEDKKEIKGYSKVNIVSIVNTNSTQV